MFFFLGGMQPKTVNIDKSPRLCPSCGLLRARYKRIDHYLSLFFVPIIRIKKGDPFLYCDRCGDQTQGSDTRFTSPGSGTALNRCRYCGHDLDSHFKYCPFCGKPL